MNILAIETSCDETALAVVSAENERNDSGDSTAPTFTTVASALHSQADMHAQYGGVFPAMAKREHASNFVPLLEHIKQTCAWTSGDTTVDEKTVRDILEREPELADGLIDFLKNTPAPDIEAITVTSGPGLEPALWVGINAARAIALTWNIPLVPTNHMEGHISSVLLSASSSTISSAPHPATSSTAFPAVALLISGGHTELVETTTWGTYTIIGQTRDDAVGEAYDKVARMLGLPYPGGPHVSRLAQEYRDRAGDTTTTDKNTDVSPIEFPRPMLHSHDCDFSFSGLKTAVLYTVQDLEKESPIDDDTRQEIAFAFEEAVTDLLVKKTERAIQQVGARTLIVGGGVIANTYIREKLGELTERLGIQLLLPEKDLATDNAVMIAIAGYFAYIERADTDNPYTPTTPVRAEGNLSYRG